VLLFWAVSRLLCVLPFLLSPHILQTMGEVPASFEVGVSRWDAGWLLGYMAFTARRFGEPLLFLSAQGYWRNHIQLAYPFGALLRNLGRLRAWADHHLLLALLGLWLTWRVSRARDKGPAWFVVPSELLSFSLSKLAITPRLQFVLFPLWVEAAAYAVRLRRWQRILLGCVSAALGCWLALRFSRALWVE